MHYLIFANKTFSIQSQLRLYSAIEQVHPEITASEGSNLQKLDRCFTEKFHRTVKEHVDELRTRGNGNLEVYLSLNPTTRKMDIKINGCFLTSIRQVFGSSAKVRLLFAKAEVKTTHNQSSELTLSSTHDFREHEQQGASKWMQIIPSSVPDAESSCKNDDIALPKVWSPYLNVNLWRVLQSESEQVLTANFTLELRTCYSPGIVRSIQIDQNDYNYPHDFSLISKTGEKIECHKKLLMAQSTTMNAALLDKCKKKDELLDCSTNVINVMLSYLKGGLIGDDENVDTIFELFKASCYLELPDLRNDVMDILLTQNTLETKLAFELFFADGNQNENLRHIAAKTLKENFSAVKGMEEYERLGPEDLKELLEMFAQM